MHNRTMPKTPFKAPSEKLFSTGDQFQGNGAFAAWLGRIVKNECLMRIRKERNARLVSLDT